MIQENQFQLKLEISFVSKKDKLKKYVYEYLFMLYNNLGIFGYFNSESYILDFVEKYSDKFIYDITENDYNISFKINLVDIYYNKYYYNKYWIDENENGIFLMECGNNELSNDIVLSKEQKSYNYFIYHNQYYIQAGAILINDEKCYDVIFNFEFPLKIFAVSCRDNFCKSKEIIYDFYEFTTGRRTLRGTFGRFISGYIGFKNNNEYLKDYTKHWNEWLFQRFRENEVFFGVNGNVNRCEIKE